MNRRNFLRSLIGGVAAAAAVRTFPFRVFSFPKEIKPLNVPGIALTRDDVRKLLATMRDRLGRDIGRDTIYLHPLELERLKELGYIRHVELPTGDRRRVEGSILGLGSATIYTYGGLPVRTSRYLDPKLPPILVPDVPQLYPLRPEPFGHRRPEPSRLQRI